MSRIVANEYESLEGALSDVPEELQGKPYYTIIEHFENIYKHAGEKVFRYAALQVLSPYAPKLNYQGDKKRISINLLLLGNSGSGKSGLIEEVENIAPYGRSEFVQKQTGKALQEAVQGRNDGVELLVNDMKTIMGDTELLKTYETVIADGRIKRDTANEQIDDDDVRAAMVGAAVPSDISQQVYGGFIFRVIPVQIKYTAKQQEEILDHIEKNISSKNDSGVTTEEISHYYNVIYDLMIGRLDKPRVAGYEFSDELRREMREGYKIAKDEGDLDEYVNLIRQFYDGFRLAALHALLNLPNREYINERKEDGEVVADIKIEKIDVVVGKLGMQRLLDTLDGFISSSVKEKMSDIDDYETSRRFDWSERQEKKAMDSS